MTSLVTNNTSGTPEAVPIITDINDKRLYSESNSKVAIFADDEKVNRCMFAHMAKEQLKGITNLFVLCVDDGNKVIPILEKLLLLGLTTVVVLDEEMPGMMGSETARKIRDQRFEALIFSYSANEDLHKRNQYLPSEACLTASPAARRSSSISSRSSSFLSSDGFYSSSTSEVSLPASPAASISPSRSSSFLSDRSSSNSSASGKVKKFIGGVIRTLRRSSAKAPVSPELSSWPSPSISPAPSAWPSPASSVFSTPSSSRSSSISASPSKSRTQLLFDKVFLKPRDSLKLMEAIREGVQLSIDEDDSKFHSNRE